MADTMKAVRLHADWDPKSDFVLGPKDIDKRQTYLGSKVWRNPELKIESVPVPQAGPGEVVIETRQVGICGSDVHMAQPDEQGYIWYPGLTGFPCTLGHEISGVVVDVGPNTFNKATGEPFKGGEWVCPEEMLWCGECRPCADGFPNHCERLDEIGFNVDGGFTKYIKLPAKVLWNLDPLRERYSDEDVFRLGSMVEPTSVAYNALVERGGGIRPGENAVILGGGPIGMAGIAVMQKAGAANVILSEPEAGRREIGKKMGATAVIDPVNEDFSERVLEITRGHGASIYLEATGLPTVVWSDIEKAIWNGKAVNSTVVIVARAEAQIPMTGEVFQVRRANVVGAQGHSGHGTFPNVINAMASGMDVRPMMTKEISLEGVPDDIVNLRTDRKECKISCHRPGDAT